MKKTSVLSLSPCARSAAHAGNGGDDAHPAWFLNLRDNPEVTAVIESGNSQPMVAHVASAEERARMWPIITGKHANYAGYQKRSEREIPLVVLSPR